MIRGRSAVKAEEQIALVRRLVLCADQIAAVLLHVPRDDDVLPGVVAGRAAARRPRLRGQEDRPT